MSPRHRESAVAFTKVDPVLLNQVVALTEPHVGPPAGIVDIRLTKGALALICVRQTISIEPTGARRVGHHGSESVSQRRSQRVCIDILVRTYRRAAVRRSELGRL